MTGAVASALVTLLCLGPAPISNMKLPPPAAEKSREPELAATPAKTETATLAWRGAFITESDSAAWVQPLRNAQANLALVVVDDAYTDETLTRWQPTFEAARRAGIEPVPVVSYPWRAAGLVREHPEIAEGRLTQEKVVLRGEDFTPLRHRNLIDLDAVDGLVSWQGQQCALGIDYGVERGLTRYPFAAENDVWYLYRISGGRIPDGAEVTVRYTWIPPDTTACCPHATATADVVDAYVARLAATLHPRFVVAGYGGITRLSECLRCVSLQASAAYHYAESMRLLHEALLKHLPDAQLLVWGTELLPKAAPIPLDGVLGTLPDDIALIAPLPVAVTRYPRAESAWLDNFDALGRRYLAVTPPNARTVSALRQRSIASGALLRGVLVDAAPDTVRDTLRTDNVWPLALSRYFDANVGAPEYGAALKAMSDFINGEVVHGRVPDFGAVDRYRNAPGMALYRNLLRYVSIESTFTSADRERALRDIRELVKDQAEIDPDMSGERATRIIETVDAQGLFVPGSILFGVQLLPYRDSAKLTPQPAHEVPVEPAYTDEPGVATAEIDFGLPVHLVRIDYVTTTTNRIVLEYDTGTGFSEMGQWKAPEGGFVRGPILLRQPVRTSRIRLRAESDAPRAVLRELRVFAQKPAASRFGPGQEADAFLLVGGKAFPEAGTEVTARTTGDVLELEFTAYEPRMHGMLAQATRRDAPLWEEESVEVRLRGGAGSETRLLVNPLGTLYDALHGDAAWDGAWTVEVTRGEDRWTAVLRLPMQYLIAPREISLRRHRVNAITEESAWTLDAQTGLPGYAQWVGR